MDDVTRPQTAFFIPVVEKKKKKKIREVVVVKDSKEAGRGRGEVECSNRKMIKEKVAEKKERKKE